MKNIHGKGEDGTLKSCESSAARDEVDDSWDKQSEIELGESDSDEEIHEKCEAESADPLLEGRVVRKTTNPQLPGVRRAEGEARPLYKRKSIRIAVCTEMWDDWEQQNVSVEEENQVMFESTLLCSASSQMGEMKFNLGDIVHDGEIRPKHIDIQIERD
ncbi:hypothetical protein DPMN_095625 [Dreissena polymorpha]|uniref:Uncharacterized protein n=1 Tax=Dreissena polymorpha TaxID=45954 RepID=A0A9D4L6U4_DREPO|nr:hypothetical protein DPMN_095625 [Dreissena polymorpha]